MDPISAFHDAVHQRAARLSRSPADLDAEAVLRAVDAIPNPPVTLELLEHVCGPEAYEPSFDPIVRLVRALVLHRAVHGTEHEAPWRAPLAYEAAYALQQCSSIISLYPLRLAILDELIEHGGPPDGLADWYYARGSTKLALAARPGTAEGIEDFKHAIFWAIEGQHTDVLALATSAFAKSVAGLPEGVAGEYADHARAFVDAGLVFGFEGFHRALILQAHARLVRRSDPKAAAQALAEAVELVPNDNPFWLEVAAEHVSHSSLTEPSEATVELARRYLEQATDVRPSIELGLLHEAMGQALRAIGRSSEARHHLQEGLVCLRGRDLHNEVDVRLQLSAIELESEDWDGLEEQLRLIRARESRLSPPQRQQAARLEAASLKARGRLDEYRAAIERLGELTQDAKQRLRTSLERAQLALADGRAPADDLDVLVVEALEQHPDSRPILDIAIDIVCNSQHPLATSTLDRVAAWAVAHQQFTVVAHIQRRDGNPTGARDTLRRALGMEVPDHERLGCLHMLMCLLDDDDVDERRRIHPELERLLDFHGEPLVRIDLATSLRRGAARDPDALPRAWHHASQAMEGMRQGTDLLAREQAELEHTCRTATQILLDLLAARLPESSPRVADLAAWLEVDRPLPCEERGEARLSAASLLLVPGPFCHAAAVDQAKRLVELAKQDVGDTDVVQIGARRLAWISSRVQGHATEPAPTHPRWKAGPFDAAPQWLVDMVTGRLEAVELAALGEHLSLLHEVLLARLDVADAVLAHIVGRYEAMAAKDGARLLDSTLATVQDLHWNGKGDKPWSMLQLVTSELVARDRSPRLQTIAAAIANARNEAPAPTTAPEPDDEDPELIRAWFEQAVALMDHVRQQGSAPRARASIDEARNLLTRAVRVAGRHARPELRGLLISLGNAWKTAPGEDLDRALGFYARAGELAAEVPDTAGQLFKVRGDALIQRGTDEDLREASTLLERAVALRTGRYKAEALASLAEALGEHPDLSRERRLERSAETYLDAARTDEHFGAQILPRLLGALDRWEELQPVDPRPGKLRDELARIFPDRAEEIRQPRTSFSTTELDLMVRVGQHPATQALHRTTSRLQHPEEAEASLGLMEARLSPEELRAFREQILRDSLLGNPAALQVELARIDREDADEAIRPGLLAARALVLGELVRGGHGSSAAVRQATGEAMAALYGVADAGVRAFIITVLARMWLPDDHAHDPLRDFGFAVEMLREAIVLQGGEEHAMLDTIEFMARGYRYSSTGDSAKSLSESRRLYRLLLDRARRQGHMDLAANTLHCLAELEDHLAEGDRTERTQRIEQLFLEAIGLATSPIKRAEYTSSLALVRTQAAGRLPLPEQGAKLREALDTFDRVDLNLFSPARRRYVAANRVLCETMLDQHRGDRRAAVSRWKEHLESLGDAVPVLRASSQHNLALVLLEDDHVTPEELREALALLEQAARARTRETDARHCWETTLDIGRSIARAMDPTDPLPAEGLPWAPDEAWNQARRRLGEAAAAAEVLGPGSELAEVGYWLVTLISSAATTELALEVADQAWTILDAATPHLVTRAANREREARVSYHAAFTLAHRLAGGSQPGVDPGQPRWVLDGDHAGPAIRWMLRAQQATRRAVRARLARPQGISAAAWLEWQQALAGDDPSRRAEVLRRLRQAAPSFLADAPDLEQTWRWLEARHGAIAVAVALENPVGLVLVARIDEGQRRVSLLGVNVEASPSDPRRLPAQMRGVIKHKRDTVPYAELATWVRRTVADPVTTFVGRPPSTVLWIPDPWLRAVPPTALWGDVPVAAAVSMDLLDPYSYPGRHSSTLLGLADPGDLGSAGVTVFLALVNEAARLGPVRMLASSGATHGAAISTRPEVRDTPTSIRDLLAESPEHRTLVLIAHGAVGDPMNASIVCVDAKGQKEYLDLAQLAAHPDAFAGAQVILLSCSSGLLGPMLADPGGLAGTLISAGARWVVAPLWPISVATALEVGSMLLHGLAAGNEPWEVLASLGAKGPDQYDVTHAVQRESFVAWIG